jgi:hypothetical protein
MQRHDSTSKQQLNRCGEILVRAVLQQLTTLSNSSRSDICSDAAVSAAGEKMQEKKKQRCEVTI